MSGWEEVTPLSDTGHDPAYDQPTPTAPRSATPSTDSPFGGIQAPDGLVYAPEATAPELNWRPSQTNLTPPPVREAPTPMHLQRSEPWKPGPDPVPATAQAARSRVGRVIALAIIPVLVLLGLAALVRMFMNAYGF